MTNVEQVAIAGTVKTANAPLPWMTNPGNACTFPRLIFLGRHSIRICTGCSTTS